jgi:hypothetical protein
MEGRILPANLELDSHVAFYGTQKKTKSQLNREMMELIKEESWNHC